MVADGIGVLITVFWLLLILLAILIVSFFKPRLGGAAFLILFGLLLGQHFGPIIAYEYSRFRNDGYHESAAEGGVYKVKMPSGNRLEFAGNRHPAWRNELRFQTTLSDGFWVSFGIAGIDAGMTSLNDCNIVGERYGLNEVDLSCALNGEVSYVFDYAYQNTDPDASIVQLRCYDPVVAKSPDDQHCNARFWIGTYELWVWLFDDPERWPEAYEHLEALLDEYFEIVSFEGAF